MRPPVTHWIVKEQSEWAGNKHWVFSKQDRAETFFKNICLNWARHDPEKYRRIERKLARNDTYITVSGERNYVQLEGTWLSDDDEWAASIQVALSEKSDARDSDSDCTTE